MKSDDSPAVFASVLAGGSGTRMNCKVPKQFLDIGGKPVLIYAVETFLNCARIDAVIVAVPRGYLDETEKMIERYFGDTDRVLFTAGGKDRIGSLRNVCVFISDRFGLQKEDILVTHDAARPFVTVEMIEQSIDLLKEYDASTVACASVDTVLRSVDGGSVDEIPPRPEMYLMQTPQTFRVSELTEMICGLSGDERAALTDGTKIYLLKGKTVGIAAGSPDNIKITEPKDLDIAEAILQRQNKK